MIHLHRAGVLALACLLVPCVSAAQGIVTLPQVKNAGGASVPTQGVVCVNADGSACSFGGSGSGSSPDPRVAQGSPTTGQTGILTQGAVVTGDQAWLAGETRPYTLTPTGRLKVGLSSAGNVDPAAQLATTITADLVGCKNRATSAFSAGQTGALSCDTSGNLNINNATLSPGAATAANQATMIANAPALTTAGTASPATGTQVMGTDGTTARALLTGTSGALLIGTSGTSNTAAVGNAAADGAVVSMQALSVNARGFVFNGTSFDRARGDTTGTYVVSKGGGSLATAQVSVTTTATLLAAARTGRQKITVSVGAANACTLGNTGVTTTTGFALAPTAGASLTLDTAAALYAVCSATTTISALEQF